ncbi:MAG: carboxypeptidase regulatory-like domain-containing protein, partial [Acidobacteriota bacterium]|nr:carboxypeptidase regulatory-like domain-containing protein [Acidobacteriota bacterium]
DGIVHDAQGLALPSVSVALTETQTGLARAVETTQEGTYQFANLNPGQYQLTATLKNFTSPVRALTLEVNQYLRLDLVMQVGPMTQQIQVVGSASLLRTADASLGEVIEPTLTKELPLNGRHLLDLALLAPAAHSGFGAQTGGANPLYWRPNQNSALSVGGGRPNANYFLLDGSTDTDPTFNTLSYSPSPDAIREFKVQTGSYSAEFGGAGGAQVNIVTKLGGNHLHGDAYEYVRSNTFDARTFTDPSNIPHLAQNQFGASIGGPIRKNSTFFFANWEGFRLSNGLAQIETVPTMMERMGDFSMSGVTIYDPSTTHPNPNYNPSLPVGPSNSAVLRDPFMNDMVPSGSISSVAMGVLAQVPLPNMASGSMMGMGGMGMGSMTPGVGTGPDSNNYLDLRNGRNFSNQGTLRLDQNLPHGDTLFGRYSFLSERDFTPENLPGFGSFDNNLAQNVTLQYTHLISSTSVNVFWLGMSRLSMHRYSQDNFTTDYVSQLGIQGVGFGGQGAWGMPYVTVQGYNAFGDSYAATPVHDWDTVLQVGDMWNKQWGRHSLKVGGDFRDYGWPMWGFFQNRGYYQFTNGFTTETATNDGTGAALASLLLGLPVVKQRQAGIPEMNLRQWYADGFVQDNWRVTGNTTLNVGVRYEYMSPLTDIQADKRGSNLTFQNGVPYIFIGGQEGTPAGLLYTRKLNFAPRVGLTHAFQGKFPFVMRAGYGVFFTPVDMNTWCNQRHNVPFVFPQTQQSDNYTPSLTGFNFAPPVLGSTVVSFTAFDPHSQSQYVQQWSYSLQKTLSANTVLEIGYQGEGGYHLQRAHLINNPAPGPGLLQPRRPFKSISFLPGTVIPTGNAIPSGVTIASLVQPVSTINLLENSARSWYNAGWVDVRHRFSHGLSFLTNVTWAKAITNAPDFRSPMDESAIPQNDSNLDAEKGLACDVRLRYVGTFVYNLPGVKQKGWMNSLTNHWELATVYQAQTGMPFTISVFGDTANAGTTLGENPIRANYTGQPVFGPGTHNSMEWFNTAAFAAPPAYTFGNAGRNTVEGPGMQVADVALTREFRLLESLHMQIRGELFNALNHTNYGTPNRFVNEPQFGTITMAMHPGREAQFSARLTF